MCLCISLSLSRAQGATAKSKILKPGKVSPKLNVPDHIALPPYAKSGQLPPWNDNPEIHDSEGIKKMRASGELAARILTMAGSMVKPGVTTDTIDRAVHQMAIEHGAYPSPLNYGKFPKSVCTSINECLCHGIPDSRPLEEGDIINIDVTVFLDGHHGDCSRMFMVGDTVSEDARKLCEVNRKAVEEAIAICKPGVPFKEIGKVITRVAKEAKVAVNKDFVGHGVGKVFHASPAVYPTSNPFQPEVMQVGQTFTIEPIFTLGTDKYKMWSDNWTAVTRDGSWAAQHEHTVLITETGVEILTPWHTM